MKVIALDALGWDIFESGVKKAGGAGTNFIYYMHHMGADAAIISAIGKDEFGRDLKLFLKQNNIHAHLQVNNHPTSIAKANVNDDGIPHWQIHKRVSWDYITYDAHIHALTQKADIIYFGSLLQRNEQTCQTLRQIISHKKPSAKSFVDVNIRQDYYTPEILDFCLNNADFLKISSEEMPVFARTLSLPENPDDFFQSIKDKVEMFIFTRGSKGARIYRGNEISEHKGFHSVLKDTVGAGDSFSATACALALKGYDLTAINHFSNSVASYICSKEGAMQPIPLKIFC